MSPAEASDWVAVPQASAQALAYYDAGVRNWILESLWPLAVLLAFAFLGGSARLRDFARRSSGGRWLVEVALYGLIFTFAFALAALPTAWLHEQVLREFGLSRISTVEWLAGRLKSAALQAGLAALLLWIPYRVLRKSPRRAWLWAWLVFLPFYLLMQFIGPAYLEPMTKERGRMRDAQLEARLLVLAREAGIEHGQIVEERVAGHPRAMRAHVNGIGSTARIVLTDTLVDALTEPQLRFSLAHEMGHHVLHHKMQDAVMNLLLLLGIFGLAQALAIQLIARYPARLGFDRIEDVASLPLIALGLALGSALATPIQSTLARIGEHDADVYALELTRDNRAAAESFVRIQRGNLSNPRPNPVIHALRGTHPPLAERVEFANRWRPQAKP